MRSRMLVVSFVSMLAAACGGPVVAVDTEQHDFDAKALVVVTTYNGAVEVESATDGRISVTAEKNGRGWTQEEATADLENIEVEFVQEAGALRIEAHRTDTDRVFDIGSVDLIVSVPAATKLELRTGNGSVTSQGVRGDIKAETGNGKVELKGAAGRIDVHTGNGAIRIEAAAAARVSANTGNGEVRFCGPLAAGETTLSSGNGAVRACLPATAAFHLRARTGNGDIRCEFPLTAEVRENDRLEGTVGASPEATLDLHAGNGAIEVTKL